MNDFADGISESNRAVPVNVPSPVITLSLQGSYVLL